MCAFAPFLLNIHTMFFEIHHGELAYDCLKQMVHHHPALFVAMYCLVFPLWITFLVVFRFIHVLALVSNWPEATVMPASD